MGIVIGGQEGSLGTGGSSGAGVMGDGMGPWLSRAHIQGPGSVAASPPVHWLGLVPKASRSCVAELWPGSFERKSPVCPAEFLPFLPGQLRGSEV